MYSQTLYYLVFHQINIFIPFQRKATLLAMHREEKHAQSRSPENDLLLFKGKCDELKCMLAKFRAKGSNEESRTEVALTFVQLKQLSRFDKYRGKSLKDAVSRNRMKVDEFNLKLQNLLYEVIFLEKEIKRSLDYTSKADLIVLDDLETFYRDAPPEILHPVSH